MPAVGLGTWQGQPGSEDAKKMQTSIIHALKSGYRLIDTAQMYGVEAEVGAAIRDSGIPRSEITVVTKFFPLADTTPAQFLEKSLKALDIGYIDVLLMHWPNVAASEAEFKAGKFLGRDDKPTFVETWKGMEEVVGEKCKAIGVSNFSPVTLETLLRETKIVPAVNQVELHALNPNLKLVPWCKEKGIHVMSWSTLGGNSGSGKPNPILSDKTFKDLAEKYGCSAGVISLSWAVQRGVTVIPMSSSLQRLEDNIKLVTLSQEDIQLMNAVNEKIGKKRLADGIDFAQGETPGKGPTLFGWTMQEFGWDDEKGNWAV